MSLKIYFSGSISGGKQDVSDLYGRLIKQLQAFGTVLTEHVGAKNVEKDEESLTDKYIHDRDVDWLKEADVVVAEVTQPSLGVGYEIGRAVALKKRIFCLYRPTPGKCLSPMIAGADNGNTFTLKKYSEPAASEIFKDFF